MTKAAGSSPLAAFSTQNRIDETCASIAPAVLHRRRRLGAGCLVLGTITTALAARAAHWAPQELGLLVARHEALAAALLPLLARRLTARLSLRWLVPTASA